MAEERNFSDVKIKQHAQMVFDNYNTHPEGIEKARRIHRDMIQNAYNLLGTVNDKTKYMDELKRLFGDKYSLLTHVGGLKRKSRKNTKRRKRRTRQR
jgi:hypothetical protein